MADVCVICGKSEAVLHSHHTVPQSRGGKDSLQIVLCSGCHNILHANASYVVSKMRNPGRDSKTFWKTENEIRCAEPWLQILVRALITPNAEAAETTEHIVTTKLVGKDFQLFKILSADLGCSQEKAVEYCIKYVLSKKGITSEKTMSELWFMPVSKP